MKLNTQRTSGGSGGQPAAARQAWHTLNPKPNPNHCKAPTLGFTRIEGRALESAAGVLGFVIRASDSGLGCRV